MTDTSTSVEISTIDCDEHGEDTLAAGSQCVLCLNKKQESIDQPAIRIAIGLEHIDRGRTASKSDLEAALNSTDD